MHIKYKQYRNLISTLLKKNKRLYFTKFFNDNLNNLENTWKGIKNLISLKTVSQIFFLSPTDKNGIISIIYALDSQKASGPNSIPIKILKLMKNDVSDRLTFLLHLLLFQLFLKPAK